MQKRIKTTRQSQSEQTLVLNRALLDASQLSAVKEQLAEIERTTANYEANVPVERGLGEFLHRIAGLMNELELSEQQVQPGEEIKTDKLNCIPVNMKCKGRLPQIFEFYRRIQKMDRLIRIEQVKLENDNDYSGEVSMQTKGIIYYRTKVG